MGVKEVREKKGTASGCPKQKEGRFKIMRALIREEEEGLLMV